jgi:hypothetical protein
LLLCISAAYTSLVVSLTTPKCLAFFGSNNNVVSHIRHTRSRASHYFACTLIVVVVFLGLWPMQTHVMFFLQMDLCFFKRGRIFFYFLEYRGNIFRHGQFFPTRKFCYGTLVLQQNRKNSHQGRPHPPCHGSNRQGERDHSTIVQNPAVAFVFVTHGKYNMPIMHQRHE